MKIVDPLIHRDDTSKIKNADKSQDPEELMEACRDFEAIFLNILIKQMRRTVPEGGLVEKSFARDIYESMQDEEIAKEISKGQGVGIAQEIYKQLSRTHLK